MLEPRTVINHCYILQERLGEDSFSELWRATSIYSAMPFLLRFLKESPGFAERLPAFKDYAMECYSIAAPSVMDFVEFDQAEGRQFLSSEFGGLCNLRSYLATSPKVRLEHVCRFIVELGQGLDAFHRHGIVYRCLGAESVLVGRSGELVESIKVQKPGYAPLLSLLDQADKAVVLENYSYLSPEAKKGGDVDPRSDI
jgi:serine/threonine protein kinase